MSWQPIESCKEPDMKDVLIGDFECVVIGWREDGKWWCGEGFRFSPTHWMPLPPPPEATP